MPICLVLVHLSLYVGLWFVRLFIDPCGCTYSLWHTCIAQDTRVWVNERRVLRFRRTESTCSRIFGVKGDGVRVGRGHSSDHVQYGRFSAAHKHYQ